MENNSEYELVEQREEGTDEPFWDLYVDGECINLGEPFWEKPSHSKILNFIKR